MDYYVASIYDETQDPSWELYVMTLSDYNDCVADSADCPSPVATAEISGNKWLSFSGSYS